MKTLIRLGSVAAVMAVTLLFTRSAQTAPAEDAALKLWNSLDADQKKQALLPFEHKERYKEDFPAVPRAGLPFTKLSKEQKELVIEAVAAMTTKYGADRIARLAKQTPDPQRYLSFYGTPEKGKPFAWRMAQHHLTLVYVEFGGAAAGEFGPVLLGGNPVGDMWDEEDQLFRDLHGALSQEEVKQADKGIQVGDMSAKPRELARKLLAKRLEVFNPDYRGNFDAQLKNEGGVQNLRLIIKAANASKSHHKGGRYNWSFAGKQVFCDWQTIDNEHIHLTLRAKPQKKG
jgi:hypothetical protein